MVAQLIAIDGNICVGKMTFARTHSYRLIEEPVGDNPCLEKFYAEPRKYAFEMEMWLMKERARAILEVMEHTGGIIIERTYHTCLTFSWVLYQHSFLTHAQWLTLKGLHDRLDEILPAPDALIVLDASSEVCYERMTARAWPCEKAVTLGYLEDIHKLIWVHAEHMGQQGTEVIRLDWTNFRGRDVTERLRSICTRFLGSTAVIISYGKVRCGVYVKDIKRDTDQILGFQ